jgi:uncharacterized repeat protein (TIGR03803 family)
MLLSTPPVHAQTYSLIHSFNGADGASPYAGVSLNNGVLYGSTFGGGNTDCGTLYQLAPAGSNWAFTSIYLFQGGQFETDGCAPQGRPVFGPDGHLYATASVGGQFGSGLVFRLTPPIAVCKVANCFWKQDALHQYPAFAGDGRGLNHEDLVWDARGNIYGMTGSGGSAGMGTVFEMMNTGNNWTEAPIYSFTSFNNAEPQNGVVFDSSGNIFGVTNASIFELSYVPGAGWQETTIHEFDPGNDGGTSYGALIIDDAGNLYGTTSTGGPGGAGTVFELFRSGNAWNFEVIYSFSGTPGTGPFSTLSMDSAGNLYGTTYLQGANGAGNVFKLSNTPNGWEYSSLHDFTGLFHDGYAPISQVTIGPDGTLYGTTTHGGQFEMGAVWMIKP